MYITEKLTNFLNLSENLSQSHIILTDKNSVVFLTHDKNLPNINTKISKELNEILKLYSTDQSLIDYINTNMDRIIPICEDFNSTLYKSQIILPIFQNNLLEGLLIFLSEKEHYLPSNLKFAKTTKHFVEIFSSKKYQ